MGQQKAVHDYEPLLHAGGPMERAALPSACDCLYHFMKEEPLLSTGGPAGINRSQMSPPGQPPYWPRVCVLRGLTARRRV